MSRKPPPPRFLPGDFVKYRMTEDAMIDDVHDSGYGYNLYKITLLNSGMTMLVPCHTLAISTDLQSEFDIDFCHFILMMLTM